MGAAGPRPARAMGSEAARLLEAADFAARKHRRQRRRDPEGTPYINHPIGARSRGAVWGGGRGASASLRTCPRRAPWVLQPPSTPGRRHHRALRTGDTQGE